jgi:hypothetical protein
MFLETVASIVGIASVLGGVWIAERRRVRAARGNAVFGDRDLSRAKLWYVPAECQEVDPSEHDEPGEPPTTVSRQKLAKVLDLLLAPDDPTHVILLLGDSGMGKTSALLNYWLSRSTRILSPYTLRAIPIAHADAWRAIEAAPNPESTVLLLDAFDEYAPPPHAYELMKDLLTRVSRFAKVVITCRTHYFGREDLIPSVTPTRIRGPLAAGEAAYPPIRRLYVSPFSDRQLRSYLRRRYKFDFVASKRAERLLESIRHLAARPMLLSLLNILDEAEPPTTTGEIYGRAIDDWLEHEFPLEPERQAELKRFSTAVAIELARSNRVLIEREEALRIAAAHGVTFDEWQLSVRSLLNRNAKGEWKFAHRSILEFLAVEAAWTGEWAIPRLQTRQMQFFFWERAAVNRQAGPSAAPAWSEEARLFFGYLAGTRLASSSFADADALHVAARALAAKGTYLGAAVTSADAATILEPDPYIGFRPTEGFTLRPILTVGEIEQFIVEDTTRPLRPHGFSRGYSAILNDLPEGIHSTLDFTLESPHAENHYVISFRFPDGAAISERAARLFLRAMRFASRRRP